MISMVVHKQMWSKTLSLTSGLMRAHVMKVKTTACHPCPCGFHEETSWMYMFKRTVIHNQGEKKNKTLWMTGQNVDCIQIWHLSLCCRIMMTWHHHVPSFDKFGLYSCQTQPLSISRLGLLPQSFSLLPIFYATHWNIGSQDFFLLSIAKKLKKMVGEDKVVNWE